MQYRLLSDRGLYYKKHLERVTSEANVSWGEIQPGMILKISYKAEYRRGYKESLYLCLHPKYHDFITTLDLDYIHPNKMKHILALTRAKVPTLHEITSRRKCTLLEFRLMNKPLYNQITAISGTEGSYHILKRNHTKMKYQHAVVYEFPASDLPKKLDSKTLDAAKKVIRESKAVDEEVPSKKPKK